MLSHGWAVDVIRAVSPEAQVGITLNLAQAYPTSDSPEDEAAAWRVDGEGNRWFLDPIFRGAYPADLLDRNELVSAFVQDGDLETISAPIDFLGVNNYFRFLVSAGDDGPRMERHSENQHTDMGWEVYPDGLHQLWSGSPTITRRARSTSPRTEPRSATSAATTVASTIPNALPSSQSHIDAVSRAVADGAP